MELTPDQKRLMTFGHDPDKFAAALARNRKAFIGGNVVMAEVRPGGRLDTGDDDDEISDDATPAEICAKVKTHIDRFLAAPDAEESRKHLGYASALMSAAMTRCGRTATASQRRAGR